ncbi:MAG: SPFH domain-containing protein [Planctomycetia bacterium]|nr:SPFH domain-containing protein [Planctomycetia bacterium]
MAVASIIKYEGDNSVFIWKHPCEDFNTATQLIVHESQEAVFFRDGQALDLFGPGRYSLEAANLPLVRKFFAAPTGGETPFHCEVYFINKTEQLAVKWGTDSRVQFLEPTYQFPISVGASGELSLRVADSRKLLVKVVGTERELTQETLIRLFRAFLQTRVKTYLAQTFREKKISVFEIDEHLTALSDALRGKIVPDFADYGVLLEKFFVMNVVKPDGDPQYEKFKELHFRQFADITEAKIRQQVQIIDQETEAKKRVIEAQSLAEKRRAEGYTYQQERGFDVAENLARNEGTGNFSSAGIGLGMMTGVGGAVGGAVGGVFSEAVQPVMRGMDSPAPVPPVPPVVPPTSLGFCVNCGFAFEKPFNFCPQCGRKREEQQ